jgi:RND family efflux transporter MFP subunit
MNFSNASALTLLAAVLLFSGCSPTAVTTATRNEKPVVAVLPVRTDRIANNLTLVAEFRPYREVDLMAKVSGYVSQINVDIGDRVQTGQVLATLEIPEMADDIIRAKASVGRSGAEAAKARDDIRRAESANNLAQLNYERLSKVIRVKPGLVAQHEIDAALARSVEAGAQLSAARSALSAAEQSIQVNQSDEHRVQTMFNYTKVVAPFSGTITRRYAEIGAMVQAGTNSRTSVMPVVRLSQDNMLRLQLPIPESLVPLVHVGFPVQIHVKTLNKTINAKISRASATLALATRTMEVQVDVNNTNYEIKPGMFAEVIFPIEAKVNAIVAPVLALDGSSPNRQAFVVNKDGVIESRQVKTGIETSDTIEIISGLVEGEQLIVSGRARLKPGMTVTPKLNLPAAVHGGGR